MRVKKITIKEQAYKIIKDYILSGKYKLGEKINIDNLSRELEISNSPIREALTLLEKEGLVVNTPNSGTKVMELSEDYMVELNQSVYVLISGSYDLCIINDAVDSLIEQMETALQNQLSLLQTKKYQEFVKATIDFDRTFIAASKNKRLLSIFDELYGTFYLAVIYEHQHKDVNLKKNIDEHIAIIDAVKNKSPQEVKALIYKHFDKHF